MATATRTVAIAMERARCAPAQPATAVSGLTRGAFSELTAGRTAMRSRPACGRAGHSDSSPVSRTKSDAREAACSGQWAAAASRTAERPDADATSRAAKLLVADSCSGRWAASRVAWRPAPKSERQLPLAVAPSRASGAAWRAATRAPATDARSYAGRAPCAELVGRTGREATRPPAATLGRRAYRPAATPAAPTPAAPTLYSPTLYSPTSGTDASRGAAPVTTISAERAPEGTSWTD